MIRSLEKYFEERSRHIFAVKGNSGQAGFGLIIILLVVAIIALLAGTYYSSKIKSSQETKRDIEQQAEQLQQSVQKQVEELEKKLPEDINGTMLDVDISENE